MDTCTNSDQPVIINGVEDSGDDFPDLGERELEDQVPSEDEGDLYEYDVYDLDTFPIYLRNCKYHY